MKNKFYGKRILENSLAENYADDIFSICGYDDLDNIPNSVLESKQDEIYEFWKAKNDKETIYTQSLIVLAYLLVKKGCNINHYIKTKAIEFAKSDEYAEINLERRYIMNQLVDILENYNNVPTDIVLPYYQKSFLKTTKKEILTIVGDIILNMNIPCVKKYDLITRDMTYSDEYVLLLHIDSTIECDYTIFKDIFDVEIMFIKNNI
jgi:hypothetical protein